MNGLNNICTGYYRKPVEILLENSYVNERIKGKKVVRRLLFLVAVRSSALLALVRCYLMSFSFFTTRHSS